MAHNFSFHTHPFTCGATAHLRYSPLITNNSQPVIIKKRDLITSGSYFITVFSTMNINHHLHFNKTAYKAQ